jgi:hypothetical protein
MVADLHVVEVHVAVAPPPEEQRRGTIAHQARRVARGRQAALGRHCTHIMRVTPMSDVGVWSCLLEDTSFKPALRLGHVGFGWLPHQCSIIIQSHAHRLTRVSECPPSWVCVWVSHVEHMHVIHVFSRLGRAPHHLHKSHSITIHEKNTHDHYKEWLQVHSITNHETTKPDQ